MRHKSESIFPPSLALKEASNLIGLTGEKHRMRNVQAATGGTKYKNLETLLDTVFNDSLLTLHTYCSLLWLFSRTTELSWWAPELHQSFQSATGLACEETLMEGILGEVVS